MSADPLKLEFKLSKEEGNQFKRIQMKVVILYM